MNTNEPGKRDEALHGLLKEWRADAQLPARFQDGVWRRIERAQTPAASPDWDVVAGWIGRLVPRPALAASYVAILLTIGVTTGWTQARQETARVKGELADRYIRVLDPYQPPRQ
ncbi:MAG: hypothetical protein ABSA83_15445 [Verrucomicrobiota bacterium]|jgi:hypothetical protein